MICPKCGKENSEKSKFCSFCGEEISKEQICPKCGEVFKEDAIYCDICGTKLEKQKEQEIETKKCPHCGKNNKAEDVFCKQCGYCFEFKQVKINDKKENKNSTGLILSIISLVISLICCTFAFVSQIASIVLATISIVMYKKDDSENKDTTSLILAIVALIISILFLVLYVYALTTLDLEEIMEIIKQNGEIQM